MAGEAALRDHRYQYRGDEERGAVDVEAAYCADESDIDDDAGDDEADDITYHMCRVIQGISDEELVFRDELRDERHF